MKRIDNAISDIAYILDSLIALRNIQSLNNCNTCLNKLCKYRPQLGEQVRYNCAHYDEKSGIWKKQGDYYQCPFCGYIIDPSDSDICDYCSACGHIMEAFEE